MIKKLKHTAMTKNLVEEVSVYGSKVLSVHLSFSQYKELFNRGFCNIKTENHEITLWAEEPFKKVQKGLYNREWKGVFTTEIINGKISMVRKILSIKTIEGKNTVDFAEALFKSSATDIFSIEGLLSTKVSIDLPPEEIYIQSPIGENSNNINVIDNQDKEHKEERDKYIEAIEEKTGHAKGYIKNTEYYLEKGGAFEEGLPRSHKYKSVQESELFHFIQNTVGREEKVSNQILSKVDSIADLTEISNELNVIVDKAIMAKREGNLNEAFKYYNEFFEHNKTWFMLWYGLAKLLCLFREYKMAFACIKICTHLYPKMWGGRQYTSDHNLSYHYERIYALAFNGDENESYLKSLGRPLNTITLMKPSGKAVKNAPGSKIVTIYPEDLKISNSENETPIKHISSDNQPFVNKRSRRRNRRRKDK